jgi:hypothetical protein
VQLGGDPQGQLGKALEHIASLGPDIALPSADIKHAAKAVELGLIDPAGIKSGGEPETTIIGSMVGTTMRVRGFRRTPGSTR